MARKKKHEEHENLERWLVSYADFITLLFAFFVVMYAISQVDNKKLGNLMDSMAIAFKRTDPIPEVGKPKIVQGPPQPSVRPIFISQKQAKDVAEQRSFERVQEKVKAVLKRAGLDAAVRMKTDGRGLVLSLESSVFFDSGSADLRPEAVQIVDGIAGALVEVPNPLRVDGHTDNVPIQSARFPSNWELSTARATTILYRFLSPAGIPPERLSAGGYAEYRPVAGNETPEGRGRNRRVDVVLISGDMARQEPGALTEEERKAAEKIVPITELGGRIERRNGEAENRGTGEMQNRWTAETGRRGIGESGKRSAGEPGSGETGKRGGGG